MGENLELTADSSLVERASSGDSDAFESLVARYQDRVYSIALRIRYLYPLYFSLPILYLYLFPYIKKTAVRYIGFSILLFIVLFPNNINTYIAQSKYAAKKTDQLEEVVAFLKKSGQKFWLSEYWNAYLMTALAKEDVLVVFYTNKNTALINCFTA